MFLRAYHQATKMRLNPLTGLAVTLFTAFMYALDDEYETRQLRTQEPTDLRSVMSGAGVSEVWEALRRYCSEAGCWEAVRREIIDNFLDRWFEDYRKHVETLRRSEGGLDSALALVEIDSGHSLRCAYRVIRAFNGHEHDSACEEQFGVMGVGGKFMDDLSDFREDVMAGAPNLLWSFLAEEPRERNIADAAVTGADLLTPAWWRTNCPMTYRRYSEAIIHYRRRVVVPGLVLTLDLFLALLGTDRFWRTSTVRTRGG
ncbi:hypothetical protein [Pedococcus sp. 5OH_020]|uniref:hypothetical protein n=1 Tax=Pedococcus sp. 5OH_020 TaxID=2989814 RepID=UPI0022E9F4E8|nr:hypothetical protein [Pedococcus sp. 5OH_020]